MSLVSAECFSAPAVGRAGNYVCPNATGAVVHATTTCRCSRTSRSAGNKKVQFRLSAYNVFNHPQRQPDDNVNLNLDFTNGSADQRRTSGVLPDDNKYGRRIIQMAFKFYF